MSSPKEFHIDAIYPEPLSRLRRGHGGMASIETNNSASYRRAIKKQRNRGNNSGRFRTQPVTFQEIKEVDEDNIVEPEVENLRGSMGTVASSAGFKSESDLKASFQLFYQSIKAGNDDDPTSPTPLSQLEFLSPLQSSEKSESFDSSSSKVSDRDGNERIAGFDSPTPSSSSPSHPVSSPIAIYLNTRSRQSF